MQKRIRYELLREAPILPEIHHDSVGGAIMRAMRNRKAIAISQSSFILPWWDFITEGNIQLGWGKVKEYPSGGEGEVYIVQRVAYEHTVMIRCHVLDGDGYPIKEDSFPIAYNLPVSQALVRLDYLRQEFPDFFFDIFPQGFPDTRS